MAASRFVVDASVVAKWYFNEPLAEEADRLADSSAILLAPDLVLAELAHVVRRRTLRREVSPDVAETILPSAASRLELRSLQTLLRAAFRLSLGANLDVYDAIYLTLAIEERIPAVTADERLVRAVRAHGLARHVWLLDDPRLA